MKLLRHGLLAASAIALTACATATPYQPASEPGAYDGFTQTMIENDRARISFAGNSLTERETVENYLLYRSAEAALERGFDWFELQERDTEEDTRIRATSTGPGFYDPYFGYSFYRPRFGWSRHYAFSRFGGFYGRRGFTRSGFYSGFDDPFFNDVNIREITKYRATAEVRFGRGAKPESRGNAFDAREVIENLGPQIKLPEDDA